MHHISRRKFLNKASIALCGVTSIGLFPFNSFGQMGIAPIKVTGKIADDKGKGISRVVMTDGINTALTDKEGNYELLTNSGQEYVYMSIPAGYQIPRQQNGSAAFFTPLSSEKERQTLNFSLKKGENDDKHTFLVLADPQIQNEYEAGLLLSQTLPDVQKTLGQFDKSNAFGIGCGDLVFDKFDLYKDYNQMVQGTDIPFFQVIGNHDLDLEAASDKLSSATFKEHYGPAYYSFNRGEIHYVVLDDVFYLGSHKNYLGYIDDEQLSWLEKDLSYLEKGQTVVVSVHIPLVTGDFSRYPDKDQRGGTVSNREKIYELLSPFQAHVMSGHTHFNDNRKSGNLYEHCHGTVCGAWWSGPICYDGTPNGYGVYKAKGSSLEWHYKSTGLADDHQFRIYKEGEHPEFVEFHSVNVWNWDKDWQVTWFEDGIRKGEPLRIVSHDPLSIKLHKGNQLPERRQWVEPHLTDHMFYFKPDKQSPNIVVEAKDPFGNVYSSKLT